MSARAASGNGPERVPETDALALGYDRRLTLAYGAAHFGKSLFWHFGGLLLAFFLTEVAGLAPAAMGAILAASLMASALADMAVGRLLRRALSRPRAAASLQVWGGAASAGALLALFSTPLAEGPMRPATAALAVLAFRLAYSLFDTPQNALMTLATPDSAARSRVAALRVAVSGLAALTLTAGIMPLVAATAFAGTDARIRLFIGLGAAMSVVALATAVGLRLAFGRGPGPEDALAPDAAEPGPGLAAGPGLAPLLGLTFALLFGLSAFGKLEPYFVAYVLRSPLWGGALATAGVLGMLLSQLAWPRLLGRVERRRAFLRLSLGLLAAAVAFGVSARHPAAATACAALMGALGGGLNMLLWASLADRAAAGRRSQVGLTFGMFTAAAKSAPAVGGLLVGLCLARFDYRAEDSEALIGLMAAFPAAGAIGCVLIAGAWRLAGPAPRGRDRSPASA